jgi:hypothetical protein
VNREVVATHVTAGRGLLAAALDRAVRRRGMSVRFIDHKFLTELRDAVELLVADGSTVRSTRR